MPGLIILVIFVPAGVLIAFSWLQKSRTKREKKMTNEDFTVMLPEGIIVIGIIGNLFYFLLVLGFTIFSKEIPHLIFYLVFGAGFWVGTYLILKTLKFRVIVKGNEITVHSILGKPYTFSFDEIVSAVRQVKKNQLKSERVVIKTRFSKKLIVESAEISYRRFLQKIKSEVPSEYLVGFEDL